MVDVFISYSRSNQAVVRQLADAVKRLGYSVWWDDELPPHLSYSDVITDKIGTSKAAIVVWSQDAGASEWVRAEADVARTQRKLIQTSIDDRMPPMPFNQIQFASIGDWHGEEDHPGWMKVKASLDALCGAQAPPAPAALRASSPPLPAAVPARKSAMLVPALIAGVVAILLVGYLLLARGGGGTASQPAVANQAAPPANQVAAAPTTPESAEPAPPPPITDEQFTEAATVDAPTGSAEIRSGPAADAFVIARVARGTLITTFPQTGDWWQVRAPNGGVGYLPHNQVRLMSAASAAPPHLPAHPAPAAAPAPTAERPPRVPVPPPPQPPVQGRFANSPFPGFPPGVRNPDRYCKGPGRGTPPCRGRQGN